MTISSWWLQAPNLHIMGSFGEIIVRIVSKHRLVTINHRLAGVVERLVQRSDHDPGDLQYLVFGKLPRDVLGQPHAELTTEVLLTLNRALSQHVDLRQSYVLVEAQHRIERHLKFLSHGLVEGLGEPIEMPAGVVLVHGVIPYNERLIARAKSAARHRLVDDLVFLDDRRRQSRKIEGAAA